MAEESKHNVNESNAEIDKSLINNKFESYKLNFDYVIQPIKPHNNVQDESKGDNDNVTSKAIKLTNEHQHIQIKNRIPNLSKLNHIIKRNYLFMINHTL